MKNSIEPPGKENELFRGKQMKIPSIENVMMVGKKGNAVKTKDHPGYLWKRRKSGRGLRSLIFWRA
jgi:hypothetical protein